MNPSLELIIGPMFSGKTSELIRQLVTYSKANLKVLYVNSNLDTRCEKAFSTHNSSLSSSQNINMIKAKNLLDVQHLIPDVDVVGIDEAQFFPDLVDFYKLVVEVHNKCLVVGGLSGTSDRTQFGRITDLVPFCDNIVFLHSFCTRCALDKKIVKAPFTKRIVDLQETVCIGGAESYVPVCRFHFDN